MATERQKTCETCWRYDDYVRAGSPEQGKRIFQTLNRQGWNVSQQQWEDTPEEFHYAYDTQGKLLYAAFAMTPQQGLNEYTDEDPALRRALAVYEYDPAGRITSLAHYWQNYNSGYSSTPILKQEYAYDSVKRLRTATSFYSNPDSDGDFDLIRTETYDYDDDLDYLTEVDYNDGLHNEAQSWTYDAAGNRATDSVQGSGWSYDNLNRMSASPGYSYLHDILGNRTWRNFGSSGVQRYQWDALNRATSIVGEAYGARYVYRADGMRVEKIEGLTLSWVPPGEEEVSGHYDENLAENLPTTRYYYDGQMMVEDDYTVEGQYEPVVTVMRYGIGARGIDFLAKLVDGGAETLGFPLYDGHGNMIATLGRAESSPHFGVADLRSYDVWGSVRSGSTTGDPKQRYCANLGHVQDDESGLIYMRARYYEPWSGRFISEDPAHSGGNWNIYCDSDPVNYRDSTGKAKKPDIEAIEELVRRLFREGLITKEYFERFLNRQSDIRRVLHNQYSKMGFTLEEIAELIIDDCQMRGHKFLSGIGIGLTTLDAAFNQDPIFVMELLREIFTSGRE